MKPFWKMLSVADGVKVGASVFEVTPNTAKCFEFLRGPQEMDWKTSIH